MTSLWPQISGRGYGNASSRLWEPTFTSSWANEITNLDYGPNPLIVSFVADSNINIHKPNNFIYLSSISNTEQCIVKLVINKHLLNKKR